MERISNILTYKLLEFDHFSITVYDLLLIIVIIGFSQLIFKLLSRFYRKALGKNRKMKEGRLFAITKITKYIIFLIAFIIVIHSLGINITFLIASSAALLIGVGIGLQHTFNDLTSGLIILFEGTIQVGDVVELEDELLGIVREIGVRTSVVETRDQIHIIVPNSKFIVSQVINWSHGRRLTRLRVEVEAAYGSDEEKVKEILLQCALDEKEVENNPKPTVRLAEFGSSGIRFELLYFTRNIINIGRTKSNIRFNIYKAFRENNIIIPFPQRDLHIKSGSDKNML
jgi:small-conductance mechanosensitive channel